MDSSRPTEPVLRAKPLLYVGMFSPWLKNQATPDHRNPGRVACATPESRQHRPVMGTNAFAWRAASFTFSFEALTVWDRWRSSARRERLSRRVRLPHIVSAGQWTGGQASTRLVRARDQRGAADPCRLLKDRFRRPGQSLSTHRSVHSTNAGGISLRTIMTRRMRSSRSRVADPSRAASTVG